MEDFRADCEEDEGVEVRRAESWVSRVSRVVRSVVMVDVVWVSEGVGWGGGGVRVVSWE